MANLLPVPTAAQKLASVGNVYRAMILQAIPEGYQRDAILADLDDVIAQVATFVPEDPKKAERPKPHVTAAVLSTADAVALRDGRSVPGFSPL